MGCRPAAERHGRSKHRSIFPEAHLVQVMEARGNSSVPPLLPLPAPFYPGYRATSGHYGNGSFSNSFTLLLQACDWNRRRLVSPLESSPSFWPLTSPAPQLRRKASLPSSRAALLPIQPNQHTNPEGTPLSYLCMERDNQA